MMDLLPETFIPNFPPRLNKLYAFLQKNTYHNDQEAALHYLGTRERSKYFNLLKRQLKEELLKRLINTRPTSANKNKALIENCYTLYSHCKMFFLDNKGDIAIEIAKGLIPKLQKLELHSLLHSVAHDLVLYYSTRNESIKQQKKYTEIIKQALQNIQEHDIVMHHFNTIVRLCNARESYTPSIIKTCIEAVEYVKPLLKIDRHSTNRYIYIIIICRYSVVYDYESINKYCDEALDSFPVSHPNIRSLSFVFLHNKIAALIPLGKLQEAKEITRDTQSLVSEGSYNWYLALINRVIVCFHAKDYQEAYQLYKSYETQTKKMKRKNVEAPAIVVEYWQIIKGYLYFLGHVGLIELYTKERFYLGKFLNEVPTYSKDKAGNNINILIIQILVQMRRGQFIKIIDRVNALREYARLYTRNEETKRANIFMKMILKMEQSQFNYIRTQQQTVSLLEKLQLSPIRTGQNIAAEMIPYEVLWKEMMYILNNKFRETTTKVKSNTVIKK